MKVCIAGAGAVGGFIGARLAGVCDVSAYARGATLAALQEHGWRLQQGGQLIQAPVHASDNAEELGVQDVLIIAVKAQSLAALAPQLKPLIGPDTIIVTAMNGVPWWFGHGIAAMGEAPLASVDPDGVIAKALPYAQVVGCVVYVGAFSREPGLVQCTMEKALLVGPPAGGHSVPAQRVVGLMEQAGLSVQASANIRYDAWYKLWVNMTLNPVSALTGAKTDQIFADPHVAAFCIGAMREAALIGEHIGCAITETPEERLLLTRSIGAIKTSMLQDVEAGRTLELDALVTAVSEIGQRLQLATPNIDALLGLTRLFGQVRGLYPVAELPVEARAA